MMKKKSLAKRKMQAEKRLGKALKVPMVTKKTKGGGKKGKGGGKKGQLDDVDSVVAASEDEKAEEQDAGESTEKPIKVKECEWVDKCDWKGRCWLVKKCEWVEKKM